MSLEKHKMELNQKYIQAYKIDDIIESIMTNLLKDKPDKPLVYVLKLVNNKIRSLGINVPAEISDSNEKILHGRENGNVEADKVESVQSNEDSEFNLVNEGNEDNQETKEKMEHENGKKGLEAMLEAEKAEEQKKEADIQEKLTEKENKNVYVDTALEAEEGSEIKENEFVVEGSGDQSKLDDKAEDKSSGVKVVVKREVVKETVDNDAAGHNIKFNICSNCSKMYQKTESIVNENGLPSASRSVALLDDLESASQVEGPRPINSRNSNGHRTEKQLISVSDIEKSSSAWPVRDNVSETSTVKSRGRSAKNNQFLNQVQ